VFDCCDPFLYFYFFLDCLTPSMRAPHSFQMLETTYPTMQPHNPEDLHPQNLIYKPICGIRKLNLWIPSSVKVLSAQFFLSI